MSFSKYYNLNQGWATFLKPRATLKDKNDLAGRILSFSRGTAYTKGKGDIEDVPLYLEELLKIP